MRNEVKEICEYWLKFNLANKETRDIFKYEDILEDIYDHLQGEKVKLFNTEVVEIEFYIKNQLVYFKHYRN